MKRILFLVLVLFLIGCETQAQVQNSEPIIAPSVDKINLKIDKDLYHSGENIHIDARIDSEMALNNVSVRFYGIYASRYRLDQTKKADLNVGENLVSLDYKAPACYGCAGIKPGTYKISADVIYGNETLVSSSVDVEIRQ